MNELLQKELLSILQESHLGISEGLEFAKAKAPELVNQIFKYSIYCNVIWLIAGLMLLFICILCYIFYRRYLNNKSYDENIILESLYPICMVISGVFGIIIFMVTSNSLIKIYTAPYLYLIDYIKNI